MLIPGGAGGGGGAGQPRGAHHGRAWRLRKAGLGDSWDSLPALRGCWGTVTPGQNSLGSAPRDAAGLAGLLCVPAPNLPSWLSPSLSWLGSQSLGLRGCSVLPGPIPGGKAQGQTCLFGVVWRAKPGVRRGKVGGRQD